MALRDYINLPVIRALSLHCSGTLFAIGTFWLTSEALKWGVKDEEAVHFIELVERYVLIALWLWLVLQLFWHLVKGHKNGRNRPVFAA